MGETDVPIEVQRQSVGRELEDFVSQRLVIFWKLYDYLQGLLPAPFLLS